MAVEPSPRSLLHHERDSRRAHFVGRSAELELFRQALGQPGPRIFFVHGPAGVGKTTLLQVFDHEATCGGSPRTWIDARDLTITPDAIAAAVRAPPESPANGRRVVFLDTYELVRSIESIVARELLRRADDHTIVVLAGRAPPSAEWRALSIWGTTILPIALRNLSQDEAVGYLERRGVAALSRLPIAQFSHGHPLALAFAAEAWRHTPDRVFTPAEAPDVVRGLYEYILGNALEDPRCRALEAAAVLHTTTEDLLHNVVEDAPRDWFRWLRSLNFMVLSNRGLFPHDLVREVILSELRWRSPERLRYLTARALQFLADRVETASADDFSLAFAEFAFALGHNPRARNLRFASDGGPWLDDMRPADAAAIEVAVARHEGIAALSHVRLWLASQPAAFKVARDPAGAVVAFAANIRLELATADERARDPIVQAAWEHATARLGEPPTRPVVYCRFIMDLEQHQTPCIGMAICTQAAGSSFFLPDFTFYYVRFDRWERWEEAARLCHAVVIPELEHTIADKRFTVTIQDHRDLSGTDWMLRFCEGTSVHEWGPTTPAPQQVAPLLALNFDAFTASTRDALRTLDDPPSTLSRMDPPVLARMNPPRDRRAGSRSA